MTDEDLLKITESMQQKLGDESSAVIADDIGSLITANTQAQATLREKDETIRKLQDTNAKLIASNGALLKQVPAGSSKPKETTESEEVKEEISWSDVFGRNGKFLK